MRTKVKVKIPASKYTPEHWVDGEITEVMFTDGERMQFSIETTYEIKMDDEATKGGNGE